MNGAGGVEPQQRRRGQVGTGRPDRHPHWPGGAGCELLSGDVANIAARAQALADPGGAGTAQVASLFVAEEQVPDEAVEEAAGKNAVAWTSICTTGIQCKDSSCVGPALV